jgi:hypothetical protein
VDSGLDLSKEFVAWSQGADQEYDFERALLAPRVRNEPTVRAYRAIGAATSVSSLVASDMPSDSTPREAQRRDRTLDLPGDAAEDRGTGRAHRRSRKVNGLERVLYADVRSGRFYLEVLVPKVGGQELLRLRKLLATEIDIACPSCNKSDWAVRRTTVRTVYDGRTEAACYRITLVCRTDDSILRGLGVSLDSVWERVGRKAAGAFRIIERVHIATDKTGAVGVDFEVGSADVRVRRC